MRLVYHGKGVFLPMFLSLLFLCGCSHLPYQGEDLYGADEFVLDSYKIKEGKFSILELEGKLYAPLDPTFLEE
ncbi:MAG: hypothetical protein HYZ47_01650, partial [Simkania negevensis]|nr:hypothetical protein [Simkania negevensis]